MSILYGYNHFPILMSAWYQHKDTDKPTFPLVHAVLTFDNATKCIYNDLYQVLSYVDRTIKE